MAKKNTSEMPETSPTTSPTTNATPEAPPTGDASAESTPIEAGSPPTLAPVAPVAPGALASPREDELATLENDVPINVRTPEGLAALARLFPKQAKYFSMLKPASEEEGERLIQALTPEQQQAWRDGLERMQPEKIGGHSRASSGMSPFTVKIYHGTGNDPMRPELAAPGSIYSTDGRILAAASVEQARLLKLAGYTCTESIEFYVIGLNKINANWGGDEEEETPGEKEKEKEKKARLPICSSLDRERGNLYGACATCDCRPFKDQKPQDCRHEWRMYIVPADLSGVYRWTLAKTQTKFGAKLEQMMRPWRSFWARPWVVKTKPEVDGDRKWFVPEFAQGASPTSPAVSAFLKALATQVDLELYWQSVVATHRRSYAHAKAAPAPANMDALLARARAAQGGAPALGAPVAPSGDGGAAPDGGSGAPEVRKDFSKRTL